MSYSHYVRCPKCRRLSITENNTPLELLAEGRANITIDCKHCGFFGEYQGISSDEFEALAVSDELAEQELQNSSS
jgi:RNase P subunit RPR2